MNLLKLFKSLLVIVLLVTPMAAQEGFSIIQIEGKTCIATSKEEFEVLTAMVDLIETMRQAKAHGTIDTISYTEKVASVMKDARKAGVRMKKN